VCDKTSKSTEKTRAGCATLTYFELIVASKNLTDALSLSMKKKGGITMLQFPNQLKKLRAERGLSQEALAKQLFLSRQAVSKWEKGEGKPDLDNVIKLAEIFDVSLDCLILGKEETENCVDKSAFLYNPNTGLYERQYPEYTPSKINNFYEFAARCWPLLLIFLYFIYRMIELLLK
jgi:transcriptional regulator with XRE-family HTH domain